MMLTVFVLIVMFICVAMLWNEGMWSNTLSWINCILAALIATNWFEPAADFLDGMLPSFTYYWDFLGLWGLFVLAFGALRSATDTLSKTRVRFKLPLEQLGRIGGGVLTAWAFASFMIFTFHTAPLPRNAFYNSFADTPTSDNFFLSPDRLWLGFMQSRTDESFLGGHEFDPQSDYILKYGARRERFSTFNSMRVNR